MRTQGTVMQLSFAIGLIGIGLFDFEDDVFLLAGRNHTSIPSNRIATADCLSPQCIILGRNDEQGLR